jgi:hypothetical protein
MVFPGSGFFGVIGFSLDLVFLSDWIYQRYISGLNSNRGSSRILLGNIRRVGLRDALQLDDFELIRRVYIHLKVSL